MKFLMRGATCILALIASISVAFAQVTYPNRPVSMMVPYPAGSASDLTARILHDLVGKGIGGPVIVENVGGAGGAIAAAKVLAAPADGYYLFQGSPSELILGPLVNKGTRHRPDDFQLIAPVATSPLVLVVNSQLPVNSIDDLIALAQSRRDKPLTYGSPGPGTLYHLLGELFSKRLGVPMTHIPYKGGAPLLQDLIGGQIDFAFMPYQSIYVDHAQNGRLKLVGSLSAKKLPAPFQAVQQAGDSKLPKDFNFTIWTAYLVKKGTPKAVMEKLNSAISNALKDSNARAQFDTQAKLLFDPMSLKAGEKFYAEEISRYGELVKTIGIEPQ